MKAINWASLCVLLLLCSCNTAIRDPKAYINWFAEADHGYMQEKVTNGLRYRVQYRPAELQAVWEASKEGKVTTVRVDSLKKEYENSIDFVIEIVAEEPGEDLQNIFSSTELKAEYRNKLLAGLTLIVDSAVYEPALFHFENTYEIGNKLTCLISFPLVKNKVFTLRMRDDVLKSGILNFKFDNRNPIPGYLF